MEWKVETGINQDAASSLTLEDLIPAYIDLCERLGWNINKTDAAIQTQIETAKTTEKRILSAGLNPKPGGVYRIGIVPSRFADLHPHHLCEAMNNLGYNGFGCINTKYYGEINAPLYMPHSFSVDDIGNVIFLVEDSEAPGHNPKMPGSLLSNMRFGRARNDAWREWAAQFASVITIRPLDYASHGLIWLNDAITNWNDALGHIGYYDYIAQPCDERQNLYPCGRVSGITARWVADKTEALPYCAAAAVAW